MAADAYGKLSSYLFSIYKRCRICGKRISAAINISASIAAGSTTL